MPLYEVYKILIRLSREGILSSAGDADSLQGIELGGSSGSVQESMQEAFAALDANDDEGERKSAIDRVFGEDDGDSGSTLSALDRVLGGDSGPAGSSKSEVDREFLGILRKNNPNR